MIENLSVTESGSIRELEAINLTLAEKSLSNFIRQAWNDVEPETPLIWGWHLDAICEHLQAVSEGYINKLIINIPPRHTKPVEENTLVLMADGSRKKIKDIEIGDKVISHRGRACRVSDSHYQGELDVLKITTHSNHEVIAAYDHPFLTPDGWVCAEDLREGDTLGLVTPQCDIDDYDDISLEKYRLIGYFIGDGCTTKAGNSCHSGITCFDSKQMKDIIHCTKAMDFGFNIPEREGVISIIGGSRPWLKSERINLAGKGSRTKRVPEFIFKSSNKQIAHFLAAYWVCDGLVGKKGGARKDLYINLTSVNLPLIQDVQHLMLRLGIKTRIRRRVTNESSFKAGTVYYLLELSDNDNTKKFKDRMPLIGQKAEKLGEWDVKRSYFDDVLLPDKIVSIETLPDKARCYCISVDDDNSFTANDIAVHNSLAVSVMWPCWEWINHPGIKWLFSSYAHDLSIRDSVKCRRLIQGKWYQSRWGDRFTITSDQNQKTRFENNYAGYRLASSVRGQNTGEGGDRIVVDDPHNVKEVESDVVRLETILWWDEVMSTRSNNPKTSARVIIMQRSHEGDLSGHILEKEGVEYVHLCLPARYEPDRLLTKTPLEFTDPRVDFGEPLCPARYDDNELVDLEFELGAYATAGQLQQRPHPRGGGMFEIEKFVIRDYIDPKEIVTSVRYWDKAATASDVRQDTTSKRTAGVLMHKMKDKSFVVADVVKGKWSSTVREKIIKQTADIDGTRVDIWVEQEPGSGGKESAEGTVINLAGYNCKADRVTGAKEVRADQYAAQVGVSNVIVLKKPWTREFIREHESFPTGKYSDQVDASSGCFNKMFRTKKAGTWGRRH